MSTRKPTVMCAIYTRKSTEEGLDQEFNSLDAQRESAEAYIASQKGEGWVCVPDHYDDGGFTGGNMERPALKRLLEDIKAGKVNVIVVYKVDRLSRSLMDFSRMVEVFDKHGVAFVSTTQHFNTAQSMGRLTLNVLLSFAQFERELISERTRDKIAGARRKGKWSGGRPVLGYDLNFKAGRLTVNTAEAQQVREIFAIYLRTQSLIRAAQELATKGWTTKRWMTLAGNAVGGRPFDKSMLYHLLTNVLYIGKVKYHEEVHAGEQPAIVDEDVWARAQSLLRVNGRTGGMHVRNKHSALLKGLLFCGPCGHAMGHTYTVKGKGRCYRYYTCQAAQKRGRGACPGPSLPAEQVEHFVLQRLRAIGEDPDVRAATLEQLRGDGRRAVAKTEVDDALSKFDGVWECLAPAEQARMVRLLVGKVEYDGGRGSVAITFHEGGPKAVLGLRSES